MIKLSTLKPNPSNPRTIKDERFEQLKKSIKEFPKMMPLRPIVVDENGVVIAGNQRFKAIKALGYTEIPDDWIRYAQDLTEEETKRFIVIDNEEFGEDDWNVLQEDWNIEDLKDWGKDMTGFQPFKKEETIEFDESSFNKSADSYLNNSIRQIVLYYDVDTHKDILERLNIIGAANDISEDNSAVVLKLIEFYEAKNN